MSELHEIPFQDVIDALLDFETPFLPRYLYRLSDLDPSETALLKETWLQLPLWRRQALMEDLEELGNANDLLSFEAVGRHALSDEDARVRQLAVQILWQFDEGDLIPDFLRLMEEDPEAAVRAAAATALGRFVYLGEIEELPAERLHEIENRLLRAIQGDESTLVRRRALESVGYSSREEVPVLIEEAFSCGDKEWMRSSLLAMGRSADERWMSTVLKMLDHKIPSLRAEAARAAGELEISDAAPQLLELVEDSDEEVRAAAIWSLSQIGGEGVREVLERLLSNAEEEDEADLLENALDNLAFTEGMQPFSLFDFPQNDLEEEVFDLLEDEEEDEEFLDLESDEFPGISEDNEDDEEFPD